MVTRLLLVLAATLGIALGAAVPARAEIITGTFTYDDTDPAMPMAPPVERAIAGARVDVFSCFPNAADGCDGWGFETSRTTGPTGSFAVFLSNLPGTRYRLQVYSANAAAVVVPSVPASGAILTPFFQSPGLPAGPEITRDVAAPTDVLDFTFRFTDAYSTAHFNVADTLSLALAYATANRDPGQTDPIPPVRVTPDPTWAGLPFYNPVHKTLVLTPGFMFEDHVLLHEYAHYLEDAISHFLVLPSLHDGCTARSIIDPFGILPPINSPEHAWMEGFADYFASVVDTSLPSGRVVGNLGADAAIEAPRTIPETTLPCAAIRAAFNGDAIELDVAATLFDAFDPLNLLVLGESTDTLEGFDGQIFQIFDRELDTGTAPTIHAFRDAWLTRGLPASAFGRLFVLNGIRFRTNYPAIARAGPDMVVYEGSTVTLDARFSEDPETSALGFGWAQTSGPSVSLSNNSLVSTSFVAPAVGPAGATLTFLLRATDVTFAGSTDTVTVTVRDNPGSPSLSPALLDFGHVAAKTVLTATLRNGGPGRFGIDSSSIAGSGAFSVEGTTCGSQLAPEASCTVSVGFTPPQSGIVTGTLTVVTSNAPVASVSIDLRGRGGFPQAQLDTQTINFGSVNVGASFSHPVRLTNTGAVPLAVSGFTMLGGAGFSHTACPSQLQPGAGCTVTVTFAPTRAGPHGAWLIFQHDGSGPRDVWLEGIGNPVGVPSAYPSLSSFGAVGLGTSAGPKAFFLQNAGGAAFSVVQVSVLGHFAEFRLQSDACTGIVLQPGGQCSVTVAFSPQATGPRAGTLSFATTSGAASAILDGTGIGKPVAGAWAQLGVGASRTGFAPDETTLDAASAATLHVAWELPLKAEAHSSPAVVDGVAYLGTEDGTVYAVDLVRQSVLWSFATGGPVRSSPAVEGGVVYVGSDDGSVYALDAGTGAAVWAFATRAAVASSPAVAGGVVVVGSDDGSVYGLDAATGAHLWDDAFGAPVRSSPAIDGAVAYAAADNGRLRAYALTSGTALWTTFANGAVRGLAVSRNVVYVGSSGNALVALDARSGAQRWAFTAGGPVSAPAVAYGLVYIGSDDGALYALDARTGQGVWALPVGFSASVPAVADGVVHVVTSDGFVHAVDAWAQRELGAVEAKALSSAAVVDGAVYVGTAGGLAELRP